MKCLRRRSLAVATGLFAAFCMQRHAIAQVNVEPLRRELKQNGVGARVSWNVTSYAGNTRGVVLGASALVGGRSGKHFGYSAAAGDYSRLGGVTQTSKTFAHVRHNYAVHSHIWSDVFAQLESDRFRRIGVREVLGAGLRFELLRGEELSLSYGASYMLEYTRRDASSSARDRTDVWHRLNNYVTFTWSPSERTSFTEALYFQPRFDEIPDYHFLSVSSLSFKLSARLSARIDVTFRHESRHPPEVGPSDLETKNALELRF